MFWLRYQPNSKLSLSHQPVRRVPSEKFGLADEHYNPLSLFIFMPNVYNKLVRVPTAGIRTIKLHEVCPA
jgi:hypothetical protein